MNDVRGKINALVDPAIQAAGYELVETQWTHELGGWIVRLLIDKPGGISHEDCERVSREASVLLDVHDVVPHHYSLEVSSPGLDRPLHTPAHFRRFLGQRAKIRLKAGVPGRRNFTGAIVDADEARVVLEVDGAEHSLLLADLDKANLVFELGKIPKEGK